MSSFREKPLRLGLTTPIASEPVGGLRPAGEWRLESASGEGGLREGLPNDDLALGVCFVPGVGPFLPDRDWRFSFDDREIIPPPFLVYRVTMDGGFRLGETGLRRVVDAVLV